MEWLAHGSWWRPSTDAAIGRFNTLACGEDDGTEPVAAADDNFDGRKREEPHRHCAANVAAADFADHR